MNEAAASCLALPGTWFRYWMPYTFQHLERAKQNHVYLPLNRDHKPLGFSSWARVNYDDYASRALIFGSDPLTFVDVWWGKHGLYLYDDSPQSRMDYFERLGRLLAHAPKIVR